MQYDPIKRSLGRIFNNTAASRILFYKLLDLLLLRTWHIKRELRSIKRSMPPDMAILDAGAGFGQYSYFLAKKFPHSMVTAVDVKKEQVDDCNAFFNKTGMASRVRAVEADLLDLDFQNEFDLVLSIDVLEHIEDDIRVLTNICQSLKPGGILLISTPSDQGGSDVHNEGDASFIGEHVRDGYAIDDMESKLQAAGFSDIKAKYSYGIPGHISWKWSMKYPIRMIHASKIFYLILPLYYMLTFPFCLVLNFLDVHNFHKSGTGLIVKATK